MMRDNDVKSLLIHVEHKLEDIKKTYDHSLQDREVSASLCIDIKNVMENLRSALDYIAQDVSETIINPYRNTKNRKLRGKIYFPYGEDKQKFNESIKKNLPDLEIVRPDIHFLIEDIQLHMWQ